MGWVSLLGERQTAIRWLLEVGRQQVSPRRSSLKQSSSGGACAPPLQSIDPEVNPRGGMASTPLPQEDESMQPPSLGGWLHPHVLFHIGTATCLCCPRPPCWVHLLLIYPRTLSSGPPRKPRSYFTALGPRPAKSRCKVKPAAPIRSRLSIYPPIDRPPSRDPGPSCCQQTLPWVRGQRMRPRTPDHPTRSAPPMAWPLMDIASTACPRSR